MPLLNYTSSVPADRSISQISQMLAKAGASQVMHDYDQSGNIVALSFALEVEGQRLGFRLPTDWKQVQLVLKEQRRNNSRVKTDDATAHRVAWRITKDWVEAQLAILETRMVTTPQLFLPYAVAHDGKTLYEKIAANPQFLLGGGNQ